MTPLLRNQKGMTLVELIIVLAILAIVGAIIVPNFISSTDKARLKSDIQSSKIIYNAINLYDAEQSTPIDKNVTSAKMLEDLKEKGYLSAKEADIQTPDAQWIYGTTTDGENAILVDINGCESKIKTDTYQKLSVQEKKYVRGGVSPS